MDDTYLLTKILRAVCLALEVNPRFHARALSEQNKQIHAVYACNKVHGLRNGHWHKKKKESGKIPLTHEYLQHLSV